MHFDDLNIESLRKRGGKKWNTYDTDVLPAWVADMDFPIAPVIQQRLEEVLENSDFGYPVDAVAPQLTQILAQRCAQRFQWKINPDQVEVIVDVMQGLHMGLQMLSKPGEGALILTPIYPPFLEATKNMGRRLDYYQLQPGLSSYEIDWDQIEHAIKKDTRVLLLCNPHNPTGRVFNRAELTRLADLVLKHNLMVVADEIHSDLIYDKQEHIPFAGLDAEIETRTVTLLSASKAFNIAGLRCALMVFGSKKLHSAYLAGPRLTRGALSSLGMYATETAWVAGDEWLKQLVEYLQGNRDYIKNYINQHFADIHHFSPQATYLAWLDCRALGQGEKLWQTVLDKGRLALSDGRDFGPGGENCIRLNFATSRKILEEALQRLNRALN